jgi:acyl-CoA synthetase
MARLLTLHDPAEAARYYAAGLWQDDTLYGLAANWAHTQGDRPAARDHARRVDWAALVTEADRVATALDTLGLQTGDRVSVWMGNRIEAIAIFLACSRNGYVFNTSLHPTYTVGEVATLLERVSSKALFAQMGHGADAKAADIFATASALADMRGVFALAPQGDPDAALPADTLAYPRQGLAPRTEAVRDPDKITYLAFTSGTTGAPKGVMHSDNSLLANGRAMVRDWKHGPDTVLLTLSQMSHHIGTVALAQALVGGFELVLSDPSAGISALDWIDQTGATYVMGVPTHAIDLLAAMDARGSVRLGNVSTFYLAGAPIPRATAQRLVDIFSIPQNVYGMTECGSHQYTLPSDDIATITGTCGKACEAYEVRLFRQEDPDTEVAPGEVGEIGGRGAMRMLGYFANQDATERTFNAGGWMMSGDLGQFDADGNLQIVGRAKDVIIRGGHNIHPAAIEDIALRHPSIHKAAAIGVPDERLGERVCLIVTTANGNAPDPADILDHLHTGGLSRFDMPEYFACVDALPLGPTGKILKRELVGQVRDGDIVATPIRWQALASKAIT